MSVHIVRLGSARLPDEGLRIGTVRRPPRGVRKSEFASQDYYDVWLPLLAPTADLVKLALAAETAQQWRHFATRYRRQMSAASESGLLDALAALSHQANFSVGCYCANEERCHRSILRAMLADRGARFSQR